MLPDGEAKPMGVTVPLNESGSTGVEPANGSAFVVVFVVVPDVVGPPDV
jgi:hypothetical protein